MLKCICRHMTFNWGATNCQSLITDATNVVVNNKTTQLSDHILGFAPLVLVAWESSDLPYLTPESAPLLQILAATSTSVSPTSINTSRDLNVTRAQWVRRLRTQTLHSLVAWHKRRRRSVSALERLVVSTSCLYPGAVDLPPTSATIA